MKSYGRLAGEFALIVIGVLLALMMESAIQRSDDDNLSRQYTERLIQDLEMDHANLQDQIEFFSQVRDYSNETLSWLRSDLPFNDDVLLASYLAAEIWPFTVLSNTYEDLQNTGNIRLLENMEIRTRLSLYHSTASERALSGWNISQEYRSIIRGIIYPEIQNQIRTACPTTNDDDTEATQFDLCQISLAGNSGLADEFELMRESQTVLRVLSYRVSELDVALRLFEQQAKFAKSLSDLIENN